MILDEVSSKPIAGADIKLEIISSKTNLPLLSAGPSHSAETNMEGVFVIHALPSDSFSLRISAPGYAAKSISSDLLAQGDDPTANVIPLIPGSSIYGHLQYHKNDAVTSGIVEAYYPTGEYIGSVYASYNGYYSFENLPSGKLVIRAYDHTLYSLHEYVLNLVEN
jgi:hypothetical protein